MHFPVIGLDCEWTPVRRKNQKADVALLQIATIDGSCVLFRTCMMSEIPNSLAVRVFFAFVKTSFNSIYLPYD